MMPIKNSLARQKTLLIALAIFYGLTAVTSYGQMVTNAGFQHSLYLLYGQAMPCLHLFRSFPSGHYTPSVAFEVVLRVESECTEVITSFGISESIPAGWTYLSGEALTGPSPGILPAAGARDTLEFAWIAPPVFPLEVRYTLMPPESDESAVMFNGYGIYSLDTQNEQQMTAAVLSTVSASSPEGEEGGEGQEDEEPLEGESAVEGETGPEGEPVFEGEAPTEGESPDQVPSTGCCRPSRSGSATLAPRFSGDTLLLALAVVALCVSKPFI